MHTLSFTLPAMYGDHHVTEVRRILLALPGVSDVYASSSFQMAEITYDPAKVSQPALEEALARAGYLGDLALPVESGRAVSDSNGGKIYYRHTAAFAQTPHTVGFTQQVSSPGRALWPCPGMGPIPMIED
ncbi:MAG: heavy-metal-associated domain-containing protein [Caldilineales bacterium]|nr:heavy-metal-associated domain-containing protein [Caldilineales bacterium]